MFHLLYSFLVLRDNAHPVEILTPGYVASLHEASCAHCHVEYKCARGLDGTSHRPLLVYHLLGR